MRKPRFSKLALLAAVLFVFGGAVNAEQISGTIATTRVIFEDSELVGDVICTMTNAACIEIGAPDIKLRLNGFTMTGPASPDATPDPANPAAFCNATSGAPAADGIRIVGQENVQIVGPGMVQRFRRHGLFASSSTKLTVRQITCHHNCFSGFLMVAVTDSDIEEFVSIRNAANSGPAPCGGNCVVNSHGNRIRRSEFSGNGSVANNNNDFGIGLLFGSSGNLVERNSIGGNTNGILIHADAIGNVIRRNIIAGNPPSQVSRTFGASVGFDIRDDATVAGIGTRNTFDGNLCVSYSGPGPAPCPNIPAVTIQHNTEGPDDD